MGIPKDLIVPPFAVVASNKFDEVKGSGSYWPVRDYHWGTCEAFSTQHSDCTYLKRLLLEVRSPTHARTHPPTHPAAYSNRSSSPPPNPPTHPPTHPIQEGFHLLRETTDVRYLAYRRAYYEEKEAHTKATTRLLTWAGGLFAALFLLLLLLLVAGGGGGGGNKGVGVEGWNGTSAVGVGGSSSAFGGLWGDKAPDVRGACIHPPTSLYTRPSNSTQLIHPPTHPPL